MYELRFREDIQVTPEMTEWLAEVNEKIAPIVENAVVDLILYGSVQVGTDKHLKMVLEHETYGRAPGH